MTSTSFNIEVSYNDIPSIDSQNKYKNIVGLVLHIIYMLLARNFQHTEIDIGNR